MAEANKKEVTIQLDRVITVNGKKIGIEIIDGKQVFTGKATVPQDVADDLLRMQNDAQKSDMARMRNNGETIDAQPGGIIVGGV